MTPQYIRMVELIVKKTPDISLADINTWSDSGRLTTDWQRFQFVNLVMASESAKGARKGRLTPPKQTSPDSSG